MTVAALDLATIEVDMVGSEALAEEASVDPCSMILVPGDAGGGVDVEAGAAAEVMGLEKDLMAAGL